MKRLLVALMFVSLSALTGCTTAQPVDAPTTVTMKGKVTLSEGQPLKVGRIVLVPTDPSKPEAISALTNTGEFTLTAQPGEYKIKIELVDYSSGTAKPVSASVPKKYLNGSGETVTVETGKTDMAIRLTH